MDPGSKKRGRFTLYDHDESKHSTHEGDVHQTRSSKATTPPEDTRPLPRVPEAPLHSPSSEMIPVEVYLTLQNVISQQLSAMMSMHRDIMLEMLKRDHHKSEQVTNMCKENAELVHAMGSLERENEAYWERLSRHKD